MDITVLVVIGLAVLIGFFIKGAAGFASGLITMPIMLLVIPVHTAIAIMSVLAIVTAVVLLAQHWQEVRWKMLTQLAIGLVVGIVIGVNALRASSSDVVQVALGVFILAYVVYSFFHHKAQPALKKLGILFGFAGGILSGLFGTGGPLSVMFLSNAMKDPKALRATIISAIAVTDIIRFPLYINAGILTVPLIWTAIIFIPVLLIGLYVGERVSEKLDAEHFKNVVLVILTVAGAALII